MTTDYSQSHEQTTDFDKGNQYEEQEEYFGEHSTDSNPTKTIDLTTDYSLDKHFLMLTEFIQHKKYIFDLGIGNTRQYCISILSPVN